MRVPAPCGWLLIGATLGVSWYGMQAVHEAGHVAGAWLTGGGVQQVVLHPLTISRTDVSPNPRPLVVVWLGPLLGVIAPVLLWVVIRKLVPSVGYLARFFAGFCLVANGAYIGAGAVWPAGDADVMRRLNVPAWEMAAFGLICITTGFRLWHGLGGQFGLEPTGRVTKRHAWFITALWLFLTAALLSMSDSR